MWPVKNPRVPAQKVWHLDQQIVVIFSFKICLGVVSYIRKCFCVLQA
jgi:hypothetical protein